MTNIGDIVEVDAVEYEAVEETAIGGCNGCVAADTSASTGLCSKMPLCSGGDDTVPVIFVLAQKGTKTAVEASAQATAVVAEDRLAAGRKDDGGKAPWGLLMRGCSAALAGVVAVLQFGARKYAADSWQRVEGAEDRYKDALYRHLHSIETRGFLAKDPETGLLEWFHVACNALFLATFAANRAKAEAEKETH